MTYRKWTAAEQRKALELLREANLWINAYIYGLDPDQQMRDEARDAIRLSGKLQRFRNKEYQKR